MKQRRLLLSVTMLLLSAVLLSSASFAWFSMNTEVNVTGFELEAYSDSIFIEISQERDDGYSFSTEVLPNDKAVRPVTGVRLEDGAVTVTATAVQSGTRYDKTLEGTDFYLKVNTAATNDTYEGENYININAKLKEASSVAGYYKSQSITFSLVTSNAKYNGTGTYYLKEGNSYRLLSADDGGELGKYELKVGESELRGLYQITFGTAEAADAVYDGSSHYFEKRTDGVYPVGGLELGTRLDNFFTLSASAVADKADGVSKYYVKNDRDDYVCIGIPEADTELTDYFYWARTYSTSVSDAQIDNTLNVIKRDKLSDYYHYDTFYIKTVENTDTAKNLRVEEVVVEGSDSLNDAIRVLFVAENGAGETARALYNNKTGSITHWDGEDILFDKLLGDGEETVEINVYVYFDGTDPSVKTKDSVLSGQKLILKFAVDEQEYAV